MDNLEVQAMEKAREIEKENAIKVRAMLTKKFAGEEVENSNIELGVNEVRASLFNKLGLADKQARAEKFNKMIENIDIKEVINELSEVDNTISSLKATLKETINKKQMELEHRFKADTKGMSKSGSNYMLAIGEFSKALEELESNNDIVAIKRKITNAKSDKHLLLQVKDKYINDNADIIAEARRKRILSDVLESGLI